MGSARSLQIGQVLRLPRGASAMTGGTEAAGAGAERGAGSDGYRVRSHDTLFAIAGHLGTSVARLLDSNPDLDPAALQPGTVLRVPEASASPGPAGKTAKAPRITIRPRYGAAGDLVDVRGRGISPGEEVEVGVGRASGDWQAVGKATADDDGQRIHAGVGARLERPRRRPRLRHLLF